MSAFTNNKMLTKAFLLFATLLFISFTKVYSQQITPLQDLKTNDSDGLSTWAQAPSVNVTGIVTSTIELGTGTAGPGTIQDSQTGIAIYGNFFASQGGVKVGDSVIVIDVRVSPYNGLTELGYNSTSSVQIISSGHTITPAEIKLADFSQGWNGFEKYESMLVTVKNVTFTDTASTFSLNGRSGWSYHITDGVDTVQFRIVKNTPYYIDKPIPKGLVNITGIVSQYDNSAPYNDGYEIFAVDSASISPVTTVETIARIDYSYNLYQNYPNPFNPNTVIEFALPEESHVSIKLYNVLGEEVATLVEGRLLAGFHKVEWKPEGLSSGIYFCRMMAKSEVSSREFSNVKRIAYVR